MSITIQSICVIGRVSGLISASKSESSFSLLSIVGEVSLRLNIGHKRSEESEEEK